MKKNMRPNNTPKIVGFVVVAVVVFLLYPSGSPAGCPSTGTRYGIMMDAGSTGSRVHVFEFDYSASGAVTLKDELFVETKPGLSAFKDSPADGVASLKPLLDAAIKKVPAELARCTPIELKATAGLRLIGTEKSDAILRAVLDALRASPFLVRGDDAAIVMDGKDEGPYAWITVNFLLETVRSNAKSKTAAILDMGGASTQLVFQPDSSKTMTTVAQDQTYAVKLEGYHSSVYTHSHLGYGLKQANKKMYQAAPDAKSFPCFPKDATDTIDDVTVSNENGVQSFEKCLEIADQILKKNAKCEAHSCSFNGVAQPQLATTFSGPLYLMSYYYDRMQYFIDQDGKSTVGGLRKMAEGVCAGEKAPYAEYNKKTMCADLTYLYALLRTGYDVPESTPIYVKKKINGIETAWALGAMMVAMNPRS